LVRVGQFAPKAYGNMIPAFITKAKNPLKWLSEKMLWQICRMDADGST
jgi:hypothetical protein